MSKKLLVRETQKEIYQELEENGFFDGINFHTIMKDIGFYQFRLSDLGFPEVNDLLKSIKKIEESVGLQGWENKGKKSKEYKGFSLTYNPDFVDKEKSLYHQTWGSTILSQNFSRVFDDQEKIGFRKNTYYDTYGFRKIPKIVRLNLRCMLDRLSMPLLRSRTAYIFYDNNSKNDAIDWHKDEFPYQLLRINIPIISEPCYVLDIDGKDEYGNSITIYDMYLEPGKAYIWNTRIPHRIRIKEKPRTPEPRISIVLGLSPYFQYDSNTDSFFKSKLWGKSLDDIIKNRNFLIN
jgi:hypothetical protein